MKSDLVHDMIYARKVAEQRGLWVVIVVPDDKLPEALLTLGAVVPDDSFSGRTALLDRGRLSLVPGSLQPFPAKPFEVMFLGWGDGTHPGMANWRQQARGEVRRAA